KAHDLGVDARAARLRMLELFENDGATAITHHESVAILVPRTTRALRVIVTLGQCPRLTEARQSCGCRGALRATSDDDVSVPVLDAAHAEADRMRRGRAGTHDAEVRAPQAE